MRCWTARPVTLASFQAGYRRSVDNVSRCW
jgi:hypothetical protein